MVRLAVEQFEERKVRVRSMLVRNPDLTVREIVAATGWSMDFAHKIKKLLVYERTQLLNSKLEAEVAQFDATIQELCKECWEIIQNKAVREVTDPKTGEVLGFQPAVSDSDRLRAIEVLGRNLKMLLDIKFDAGIFKKKLGEMEIKSFSVFVDLVKAYGNIPIPKPTTADQTPGSSGSDPSLPAKS